VLDVSLLRSFFAAAKQDHDAVAMPYKVDPIAGAIVHTHFQNPAANAVAVAKVPEFSATMRATAWASFKRCSHR